MDKKTIKLSSSEKNFLGKTPPQNLEAEKALLGSILLDKNAFIKIIEILNPNDFYSPTHQAIFQAAIDLFEHRKPLDLVTLSDILETKKQLKDIGGASYLLSLTESVPTAAHAEDYAKIIRDKALLRNLIIASSQITALVHEENDEIEKILDLAEQTLFSVSQKKLHQNFIPLKDVLEETFERIDELHKNKGQLKGLPTGFTDLDFILAGLQKSDLIIVAARPSIGKTSFALNIAQHVGVSLKTPVAIFSLEMSKEQLVDRFIATTANVDAWKLRTGNLSEEDFPRIGEAIADLSEAPIFIDDSANISVLEMRAKARRLHSEHKLGLIIVDYLQLMEGRNSDNRVQEISDISRSLKGLARELNVPVIAISQLSRAVEARPSHIPQLSDLRESGSIEQDADVVIFIYRDECYDENTPKRNIADILIRKHRNGPIGQIELYFNQQQMKFGNIDKTREAPRELKIEEKEIQL